MELATRFTTFGLLVAILTGHSFGYYTFRSSIPNGFQVPHPCNPEYIWRGVGHRNYLGTGARNPFGLAFASNGFKWDSTICEMDSDEDGRSNGEELGDPDCTWTPGIQPSVTTGLSHPGICDPWDSTACRVQNDFVNCEALCDAVSEEGVFRHTVTLSAAVSVPSQTMAYECMVFDFPTEGDYHLVALAAQVDNFALLKHIIVFGCNGDAFPESPGDVHTCYMNGECDAILFHWTMGDSDICLHPDAGIRIGSNNGAYKRGLIELHLYNAGDAAAVDQSGINFFLTPNRRTYDAAVFSFGQSTLNIPPGEEDYVVNGGCSADCTRAEMTGPINVTAAFNHMHHSGVSGVSQWIENERRVNYIAYDEMFNYDYPKYHRFEEPLVISPGIRFNMECHYNTTMRNRTQHYGLSATMDEMCIGFFMYYPKENLALPGCSSTGDLDTCDKANAIIRGCDMTKLNFSDPGNVPQYSVVQDYCSVETCLKECMTLLREVRRHPCYSGSVRDHTMGFIDNAANPTEKINMLSFWLKMRSCDHEFGMERSSDMTGAATIPFLQPVVHLSVILSLSLAKLMN